MIEPSPLPEFDAVIFDMDGLMLNTESIYRRAALDTLGEYGLPDDDSLCRSTIGRTRKDTRRIYGEYFQGRVDVDAFLGRTAVHYKRIVEAEGIPTKPGLGELLDCLEARGVAKAVATSTYRETAEWRLEGHGLLERFQALVTGDDVEHGKPAPDIFLRAAEVMGVEPRRCLVLEDSPYGIEAAGAARMTPIMVPDLLAPTVKSRRIAARIVESLHEVRELIERAAAVA